MTNTYYFNGYRLLSLADKQHTPVYMGVEGNDIPLYDYGIAQTNKELGITQEHVIMVGAVTRWDAIKAEYDLCAELSVDAYLLLVASRIPVPEIKVALDANWQAIGFDVAWASLGHSAIYQELHSRCVERLCQWADKLNEYGLFSTEEDAGAYCVARESVRFGDLPIEPYGDMIVVKLWRYVGA